MGKIVLLDELTINQIAAGEVIERPASVIKEMVENSIDAGATKITVEIRNGGITYIKITDNGSGIAKDDLEMAFERHATSKIRNASDLDTVTSMGFRGEALASIAAIANVELVSKTSNQDVGYRVVVEAGNVLEKEETGCQVGTSITVSNLFFNTPVRYKFLKKDYTETGYIEDVITRIALVNPNIAFKLINSGKTIIQTSGNGDLKSVIYSIYGKDIASGIIETTYNYEDIKITGVIGKPEIARSNRSNQLFFVNKRYIKDKTLSAATEQAYKGMIPIGKFGFVVLNIEMNPSKVDVNVHPAKLEVRFEEENKVFQAIYHTIKDTLLKDDLVSNTTKQDIIIQNNDKIQSFEDLNKIEEKPTAGGLFSWKKKNKQIEDYTNQESKIKTNIIEDLYMNKKQDGENIQMTSNEKQEIDNPVDTSDVLQQLRSMQEKLKQEKENATKDDNLQVAENVETNILQENKEKKLPDASSYTYFGENKEKVESLLRQLHPNIYKEEKQDLNKEDKIKENFIDEVQIQETGENNLGIQEKNEYDTANVINIQKIEEDITENTEGIESAIENQEIEENTIDNSKVEETTINNEVTEEENKEEITQKFAKIKQNLDKLDENNNTITPEFKEMYKKLFGTTIEDDEEPKQDKKLDAVDIVKNNVSIFEKNPSYQKPIYKFIGIVFKTYIIVEIENEMYIIDQHAAHERIMYEKVKQNYYSQTNKDCQMLLLPDIIILSHKEMEIAKENIAMFNQAGFALEEFGENTIKLTGVPTICIDLDTKDLFLETLDEINTVARTAKQEKEEKFIATVACKAAVKANMALTKEEVDSLMNKLLSLPNPFTCPHGRPTAIKMTKYDIERKFARK